jgi:uncharacterized membrane protein
MTLANDIEKIKRATSPATVISATYAYDIIRQLTDIVKVQHEALKLARPCVEPMRIQAVEAQIDKALALSAPIVKEIV